MNRYFGHYLLNKGLLAPSQLSDVLQREHSVKVKLGVLAVNAGLMSATQVEEVHHLQRAKDQKFGALAVAQGFLTDEQVESMLTVQHKSDLALIQSIVDCGYMSMAEMETALAQFRLQHEGLDSDSEFTTEEELVRAMVNFTAAGEKADLLYDYVGLLLRNVVRFLNDTPFIIVTPATPSASNWLISQNITGAVSIATHLHMDDRVLLELASRFYGEPLTTVDELSQDCAGEFLNVHNGVWSGSLSVADTQVDLRPQSVVAQTTVPSAFASVRVMVGTSFGNFEVILTFA